LLEALKPDERKAFCTDELRKTLSTASTSVGRESSIATLLEDREFSLEMLREDEASLL
jgi:hypothetical protein